MRVKKTCCGQSHPAPLLIGIYEISLFKLINFILIDISHFGDILEFGYLELSIFIIDISLVRSPSKINLSNTLSGTECWLPGIACTGGARVGRVTRQYEYQKGIPLSQWLIAATVSTLRRDKFVQKPRKKELICCVAVAA